FHFLGFSLVDSTKVVFGISFVLSGLTMYLWLRLFLSKPAAFVGSLLYVFAPYRFVDLYVRGALGEHVAFIFPPLILYFLYKLGKKQSYWDLLGGSLALAGLILAHNAISLMFLPVIIFYIFYLACKIEERKKFLLSAFAVLIFGFFISAFFWLPAFFEGKYTLRDIVTSDEVLNRFITWGQMLYGPWSYGISGQFTVQFGILQWITVIVALPVAILLFKKKHKNWFIFAVFLLAFFVVGWMMTSSSGLVWERITILKKFQFPWRLLSLSVFFSAVLGAFIFDLIPKNKQKISLLLVIMAVMLLNKDYWHAKDYQYNPEIFYSGIYSRTTDTGESSPIWSVRFMESKPKAPLEILAGKAEIKEIARKSTIHLYTVNTSTLTKFRENTLYFPGWSVLIDGHEVPIQFQDPNSRGLMTFWVEKGEHNINVSFSETRLRMIADLLSLFSLLILVVLGIIKKKIWQN
ncbi:MAG TPA: 6-pyruvoyl-tetrahydropterin synthase-related protein, partial [Patescibacteria group bacterium]